MAATLNPRAWTLATQSLGCISTRQRDRWFTAAVGQLTKLVRERFKKTQKTFFSFAFFPGQNPNYKSIAEHCNLWRNFDDIYDSWDSVLGIINYYGEDKDGFGQFSGPGHWNDPDMLIIGNYGLSLDQAWAQMGMWAMFARNKHKMTPAD